MKRIILTFGLISGAICSLLMAVSMLFANRIGFERGYFVGYTTIVLSFLLVFFGIRSYRDNVGDVQITFAKGFVVGISIALISCICYVASWEIIYFKFMPDFMDKYGAFVVEKAKASGASAAAVQEKILELQKMKQMYSNPLVNVAMTFLEPFPVGLGMALISAAVLRKKPKGQTVQTALPAS